MESVGVTAPSVEGISEVCGDVAGEYLGVDVFSFARRPRCRRFSVTIRCIQVFKRSAS